jgi:hypothetical protein
MGRQLANPAMSNERFITKADQDSPLIRRQILIGLLGLVLRPKTDLYRGVMGETRHLRHRWDYVAASSMVFIKRPAISLLHMRPSLFLRAASILTLLHSIGHTVGGVFGVDADPTPEEATALGAMKSHRFEVMGSMRSLWDFFFGWGLIISISLLVQAVLFWQLASLANKGMREIRPIVAGFFLGYIGFAILSWNYFFIVPTVNEVLIAICLGLAFRSLGRLAPSSTQRST